MYVSNKEGRSQRAVAMDLGRSFGAVNDLINKAKSKKTLDNQHGLKGRYPKGSSKLTEDHKRFILEWLIQSKHKSSNEVWLHLTSIKRLKWVCYDTVNNFLKSIGKWVKPRLKTIISEKNLLKRLEYCEANKKKLWMKMSCLPMKVSLSLIGTRPNCLNLVENLNLKSRNWHLGPPNGVGGDFLGGKTQIYFVEGWINNQRYVNLLKLARKDIHGIFPEDFYFLQDNARPHVHKNFLRYIRRWIRKDIKIIPHKVLISIQLKSYGRG